MAKRRNDGAPEEGPENKRRKQAANPTDDDGLSQCFRVVKARMYVPVAPAYAANPLDGVRRQHLDPLLLEHAPDAGGVIVAHSHARLLKRRGSAQPLGKIIGESPFSFYWAACDLLVWAPQPGDVVEGWVSVQSPGHIALLIHDTFNASVKRADIPLSWEFVPQEDDENGSKSLGHWKDAAGRQVDGKLQFTIKRVLHGGRAVLCLGSLLSPEDEVPPHISESPPPHAAPADAAPAPERRHRADKPAKQPKQAKPAGKKITFDE